MADKIVYENKKSDVVLAVSSEPVQGFEEFLNSVEWGADGFVYSEEIELEKLRCFGSVYYVRLMKAGKLAVGAVVQGKKVSVGDEFINAYYMTNFAVDKTVKSSVYVALLVKHATNYFTEVLGGNGMLYGYVEEDNSASKRIGNKYGYRSIRRFRSIMFMKAFCKVDVAVRQLRSDERPNIIARLKKQCTAQVFTDFDSSVQAEDYLVYEKDGKIVAGVQCDKMRWSVSAYPGVSGVLLLRVLPKIPMLGKIVDPQNLVFLKFGNIVVEPGYERQLQALIKSVLAANGANLGMVQFDTTCPVMTGIVKQCKLGLIQMSGDVEFACVLDKLPEKLASLVARSPLHISLADK